MGMCETFIAPSTPSGMETSDRRTAGSVWIANSLMLKRLVLGLVALLVATGCLPQDEDAELLGHVEVEATAPQPAEPRTESQSSGGGDSSEDAASDDEAADPAGAEAQTPEGREAAAGDQDSPDPDWGPLYDVVSVYDGDTIAVSVDGQRERVRIIGIDAPEMARDGAAAECYAQPAASHLQSLVQGKRVHLLADPTQDDRDRYDRLLRHVVLMSRTPCRVAVRSRGSTTQPIATTPRTPSGSCRAASRTTCEPMECPTSIGRSRPAERA